MKNLKIYNKEHKTAIVTGITGKDGSYLLELLLQKGYQVVGLKRRTSLICTDRVDHLFDNPNFKLEYFDLNDAGCMWSILTKTLFCNLALRHGHWAS